MAIKILSIYDLTNKLYSLLHVYIFLSGSFYFWNLLLKEYLNTLNMFMCYCDAKFVPARHPELLIKKASSFKGLMLIFCLYAKCTLWPTLAIQDNSFCFVLFFSGIYNFFRCLYMYVIHSTLNG